MSTDLQTYLNYISTWDTESDANIDKIISEHNLFVSLGDFESDSPIESEFTTLVGLAKGVRDTTVAANTMQIAADAAAVAAIWSFGLSMAAFATFQVTEGVLKREVSSKSTTLNNKLETIDTDISSRINPQVNSYIIQYKSNNSLIASKAPKGLDNERCRALLMQFIAQVEKSSGKLDATTFRKWAESARTVFQSNEINEVYDALDKLNMSARTDADVKRFMGTLVGLQYPSLQLSIVRNLSIAIMVYKLKIANATIEARATEAGMTVAEMEESAFSMLSTVGKFVTAVAVIMSVVDVFFEIFDIAAVVQQTSDMCDKLDGTIKEKYKSYFKGISEASKAYSAAVKQPAKA